MAFEKKEHLEERQKQSEEKMPKKSEQQKRGKLKDEINENTREKTSHEYSTDHPMSSTYSSYKRRS